MMKFSLFKLVGDKILRTNLPMENVHVMFFENFLAGQSAFSPALPVLQHSILCQDLFDQLSDIDGFNFADINPKELCPLMLLGSQPFGAVANGIIWESGIFFFKALARLN